jgi:hypothetical protein
LKFVCLAAKSLVCSSLKSGFKLNNVG